MIMNNENKKFSRNRKRRHKQKTKMDDTMKKIFKKLKQKKGKIKI